MNRPLRIGTRLFTAADTVTGGKRLSVIILLHGTRQGFFSDDEPGNPHPDAWCSQCEDIRVTHAGADGGWNEESEALIKIRLVCGDCYEEIKGRNILSREPVQ